jgi:tRNA pseudouridine32 synthase / 23S rRNA pseudouridine746 synthase
MRAITCPLPVLLLLRCLVDGFRPSSLTHLFTSDGIGIEDKGGAVALRNVGSIGRRFRRPRRTSSSQLGEGGGESSWSLLVGEEGSWSVPPPITSEEVRARLQRELETLRQKDWRSRQLSPEVRKPPVYLMSSVALSLTASFFSSALVQELYIVFEDDHIILIDKPPGILTVPSEDGVPSLARVVFDRFEQSMRTSAGSVGDVSDNDEIIEPVSQMDQMVVHRLGMETSGLIVFAKSMDALRGMNSLFRSRRITRQYEALVCGHVRKDQGLINLPLMRDFQFPPYMRVSTNEYQRVLAGFDPAVVGGKLLEAPKASLTHYQVKSREYLNQEPSLPVTRLVLTSITGRTHQLNVHLAAMGYPIVRDSVYGIDGRAAPYGGLDPSRLPVSSELERAINSAGDALNMCVHASCVKFTHPVTDEFLSFTSDAPF